MEIVGVSQNLGNSRKNLIIKSDGIDLIENTVATVINKHKLKFIAFSLSGQIKKKLLIE